MPIFAIEEAKQEYPSWLRVVFEKNELQFLWDEIYRIKNNSQTSKWNSRLAGNIEKEYKLSDNLNKQLEEIILPSCEIYLNQRPEFTKSISTLTENAPFSISTSWVNFQKKYEFNPIHNHSGLFSFVIWLQIPYDIKDEMNLSWVKESNSPCAGQFQFITKSFTGDIKIITLECSRETENTMLFFPSTMHHCVYPFYTSDDERITISGNIFFDNTKYLQ